MAVRTRPSDIGALAALTVNEKATVLDELLAVRPDLRELAETYAVRLVSTEDRSAVTDAVQNALLSRNIEELNHRAGYHPGHGYVHPVEAAPEILDEELGPFLHDLERRATLDMRTAAVELAVGILLGLYACRDPAGETLLEYFPDYAIERAGDVLDQCRTLGVDLPVTELVDDLPEWRVVLGQHGG